MFQVNAGRYYKNLTDDTVIGSSTHHTIGAMVIQFIYTGERVSKEALSQLFTLEGRGENVGLWAARTVVEMHSGRVRVCAGAPGGAVFVIELPMSRVGVRDGPHVSSDSSESPSVDPPNQPLPHVLPHSLAHVLDPAEDELAVAAHNQRTHDNDLFEHSMPPPPVTLVLNPPPSHLVVMMQRLSRDSGPCSRMSFSNTESRMDPRYPALDPDLDLDEEHPTHPDWAV